MLSAASRVYRSKRQDPTSRSHKRKSRKWVSRIERKGGWERIMRQNAIKKVFGGGMEKERAAYCNPGRKRSSTTRPARKFNLPAKKVGANPHKGGAQPTRGGCPFWKKKRKAGGEDTDRSTANSPS